MSNHTGAPADLVAGCELAVEKWAEHVRQARVEVAVAETLLGAAVQRATVARRVLAGAEAQFDNAQDLLRRAERIARSGA